MNRNGVRLLNGRLARGRGQAQLPSHARHAATIGFLLKAILSATAFSIQESGSWSLFKHKQFSPPILLVDFFTLLIVLRKKLRFQQAFEFYLNDQYNS
jgi:hypothetical protein